MKGLLRKGQPFFCNIQCGSCICIHPNLIPGYFVTQVTNCIPVTSISLLLDVLIDHCLVTCLFHFIAWLLNGHSFVGVRGFIVEIEFNGFLILPQCDWNFANGMFPITMGSRVAVVFRICGCTAQHMVIWIY